tara:strand:+ start:555 stop:1244 length:690 start_codon:yes stop_codon:yes gene_type:complete
MKNIIIGIIIGIIIMLGTQYVIRGYNPVIPKPKIEYIYKTNTITKYVPFKKDKELDKVTPPKTIIKYIDTGSYHTITIKQIDTLLVVNNTSIEDSVKIHENFLKKYPMASKLIQLDLNKDSLRLTTLDISSQVNTHSYPIDLSFYKYQYSDNIITHDSLKIKPDKPSSKSIFPKSFLLGGSYSLVEKTPLVNVEYPITYRQVRLSIESTMSIETTPNLNIYLKALFQIK